MTKPVRDLKSGKPEEVCPDGLCDPDLVEETKLKIGYEDAAFVRQLKFVSDEQVVALARDYNAIVEAHPEFFAKGARYGLLGSDFANYYMKVLQAAREAGGISGSASVVYHGQYRVPELALELHQLLESSSPDPVALPPIGSGSEAGQQLPAGVPCGLSGTPASLYNSRFQRIRAA
jgi:hypothetical protein